MNRPVVITRPAAQAATLVQSVRALGRAAVLFPLLEIHPLADDAALRAALHDVSAYALVAFVSPNAIDACFAARADWPENFTFAVMGEGSRQALARYGISADNARIISPTDPERTDSQTLLQELDLAALRGRQVLIVRGQDGRELLADGLRAAGVQVTQVAAYRRAAPAMDAARCEQLQDLLERNGDWIITSSEALRILMRAAEYLDGSAGVVKMQQQKIIVPHARIAETAQMLGFMHIVRTGSGDARLLAALQS